MRRRQIMKLLATLTAGSALGGISYVAMARRGRPASPASVAGVHRRHRRRRRRRIHRNMTLYSLPYGCSNTRVRDGVTYYYCGNIWYRPQYQGTTITYVVHEIEPGASTDVEFEEDY